MSLTVVSSFILLRHKASDEVAHSRVRVELPFWDTSCTMTFQKGLSQQLP